MLGLPAGTELKRIITKKKIFEHFGAEMSAERRRTFDAEIARITLSNEISPASVNIAEGAETKAIFVLHVQLKQKDFDQKSMAYVSRMFGQKIVMVLEHEGQQRLALWQTKLIMTEWADPEALSLPLNGLDLDRVWEGIVTQIAGIELRTGDTLNEAIANAAQVEKLKKEIARLEKLAWTEKQPRKKMALVAELKSLKEKLEERNHG